MENFRIISLPVLPVLFVSLGLLYVDNASFAQPVAGTGEIRVTVANVEGERIPGARVQYTRLLKTWFDGKREYPAPGEATVHGEADADSSGQIAVIDLPVGDYAICANVVGSAYLDPCVWQQPVRASVADGQTSASTITLPKGVILNVRVGDPDGLLPGIPRQVWASPKLLVGVVHGTGAYQAFSAPTISGAVRSYQMAVPSGADFLLRFFSTDLTLSDETGAAVDTTGSGIAFRTASGQDVASYSFTVSGVAAQ